MYVQDQGCLRRESQASFYFLHSFLSSFAAFSSSQGHIGIRKRPKQAKALLRYKYSGRTGASVDEGPCPGRAKETGGFLGPLAEW